MERNKYAPKFCSTETQRFKELTDPDDREIIRREFANRLRPSAQSSPAGSRGQSRRYILLFDIRGLSESRFI